MQTDSSAISTCLSSRSALECTATVLMPSSRQVRRMRSAISPRVAIRIFLMSGTRRSVDDEEGLIELHRLAVLHQDLGDHAVLVGLDLVQHLHRFDDAQGLALLDGLADVDERLGAGRGRAR